MVFQQPTLIKGKVKDNLLIGPELHDEILSEEEIDKLLINVGLPITIKNQDARTLSGGQKQRVSLARTLANKSEILLLDEVTAALDPDSTLEIELLLQKLNEEHKKTILLVTHNLKQAQRIGKFTWVLAEGQLIEKGQTKALFANPEHDLTKKLIVSANSGRE